jgi:hypothetical protein
MPNNQNDNTPIAAAGTISTTVADAAAAYHAAVAACRDPSIDDDDAYAHSARATAIVNRLSTTAAASLAELRAKLAVYRAGRNNVAGAALLDSVADTTRLSGVALAVPPTPETTERDALLERLRSAVISDLGVVWLDEVALVRAGRRRGLADLTIDELRTTVALADAELSG